ncbi:MAG: hypothetical protein WBM86_09790 [Waterburya sp.]
MNEKSIKDSYFRDYVHSFVSLYANALKRYKKEQNGNFHELEEWAGVKVRNLVELQRVVEKLQHEVEEKHETRADNQVELKKIVEILEPYMPMPMYMNRRPASSEQVMALHEINMEFFTMKYHAEHWGKKEGEFYSFERFTQLVEKERLRELGLLRENRFVSFFKQLPSLNPFTKAKSTKKYLSSPPGNLYSDEQRRFSREEVGNKKSDSEQKVRIYRRREYITLEEVSEGYPFAGEEFYNLYEAITLHTADMSILVDDPSLEDWQKTARLAVIRSRKKLVKRLCKKHKEEPIEIARFFKCLMTDIGIGTTHSDLNYACADQSMCIIIQHVKDTSPEMFHEYLSDICLEVVEDDNTCVLLTKEYAMRKLVEFKDARIIPIIKRLAEDESALLHKAAKLELYSAVEKMPEFFLDPKYDEIKRANENFEKNAYIGTW